MSGRRTHRESYDDTSFADDNYCKFGMEDLELIVEGKKVKTNSGLLSCNSNIFASLISNARAAREAADDDDIREIMTRLDRKQSQHVLKLEMPNHKYKDVRVLVDCLMSVGDSKEELTGTKALRILPLVEHFRIKRLKKACGKALYDSFIAMRKDLGQGCLSSRDVLQYLAAADQYKFDKLRRECIDELAINIDATNRNAIQSDKHVNEKTKLKILGKICENMEREHEKQLQQVRHDMDGRCRLLEQKRDEFMEQLETWKNDLRQEVDEMIKQNEEAHQQFVKDLRQKQIVDQIDGTMKETKEGLFNELAKLREDVTFVYKTMEENETATEEEIAGLKEVLQKALETNQENIKSITDTFNVKLDQKLKTCSLNAASLKSFSSACYLEENASANIAELEDQIQILTRYQIQWEEEVLAHKKTRADLYKMKLKEHEINTWLKWAKPGAEDEDRCQCYRHYVARK